MAERIYASHETPPHPKRRIVTDYQRKIMLAEQRLGHMKTLLRNISADRRMITRQKMLQRSIKLQHQEIVELKAIAQGQQRPVTDKATRYVRTKPKNAYRRKR